jgi:hypothetical protein
VNLNNYGFSFHDPLPTSTRTRHPRDVPHVRVSARHEHHRASQGETKTAKHGASIQMAQGTGANPRPTTDHNLPVPVRSLGAVKTHERGHCPNDTAVLPWGTWSAQVSCGGGVSLQW